jgi:UDP-galactopyranose mutase
MKFDAIIAGAGLAGAVAARTLADAGRKVLVVEKHKHVAGHCHDYRNDAGITIHTYGPHIFHTNDKAVWDFANKFTDFNFLQHRVLAYANGRMVPFPINRDTINEVFGVTIATGEVGEFLKSEVSRSTFNAPSRNFRDEVVSQVGERLYDMFFKNYTMKQWGRDPETLSAEIAKRIPVRSNRDDRYFSDRYQGIPRHGYTAMVENMLDHPGISIMTGADFFDLRNNFDVSLTVFTGELDRYFDYKHGRLVYRSLDLVLETLDRERYQEAPVVNYPNDYDWTRITEFKQLSGENSPKTTICYEYPKEEGEPYYIVMDEKNLGLREKYIKEAASLEASGKTVFVGRLAEYTYYNMDQVIAASLRKTAPFTS